jgi:hypothetical protein
MNNPKGTDMKIPSGEVMTGDVIKHDGKSCRVVSINWTDDTHLTIITSHGTAKLTANDWVELA